MAYKFTSGANQSSFKLNNFLGVDLTNPESEVELNRSPDALNLIMNQGGNLEKRKGIKLIYEFKTGNVLDTVVFMQNIKSKKADGTYESVLFVQVHRTTANDYVFHYRDHNGWHLHSDVTPLLPILTERCRLIPLGNDGIHFLILGGYTSKIYMLEFDYLITEAVTYYDLDDDTAVSYLGHIYVPTTQIGRSPDGTTSNIFEQVNLIGQFKQNTFLSDGIATKYYPDTDGIMANADVKVWVKVAGSWVLKTLTTHYTVSSTYITFTAGNIPAVPSVLGEDNVKIQIRNFNYKPEYIYSARVFGTFGLNGENNYAFVGGYADNEIVPSNTEIFFIRELPLQVGEFNYTNFSSKVLGYSNLGEYQTVHCENVNANSTIYLRSVGLDAAGEIIFPTKSGLSGVNVMSTDTFASLRGEPLWLSEFGVTALVSNDVTGVNSIEDRGFYIYDEIKSKNLTSAYSFVFGNRYYLSIDNELYVAEPRYRTAQRDSYTKGYQYEWFKWKIMAKTSHINAQCDVNGVCYIGIRGGLFAFKNDSDTHQFEDAEIKDTDNASYSAWASGVAYVFGNYATVGTDLFLCYQGHTSSAIITTADDRYWAKQVTDTYIPIVAYWTTPILNMNDITSRKTLKNLWIRLMKYHYMKCRVYYSTQGIVKEQYDGFFDFSDVDFTRTILSTDTAPSVLVTNRTERKFMSIQFKVESDDANPFGLLEIVGKYTINNTFKG